MVNLGFWEQLKKPILALAPLYDVTDPAFRAIIAKYGKPDVMFTEFASADGLCHPVGKEKIVRNMLKFGENERPIVAQLFTSRPDKMRTAAKICAELHFDGIDINMGCPDETIEKQGSGACLIKNPELAQELIDAAKECGLPVSVKTRIGYNKIEIEEWVSALLKVEPAALTFHLRTRKEMSKVAAHWEVILEIMKLAEGSGTLILGNGDVKSLKEAREKCEEYGCDGVMLGRAIFGNPWLFTHLEVKPPSEEERKNVLKEHIQLFTTLLPDKNFASMKKHFKSYIEGWPGAHELRNKLMLTQTAEEALDTLRNI